MFEFATSFGQLRLNDTEIGLFTGVVLATAGTSVFPPVVYKNIEVSLVFSKNRDISLVFTHTWCHISDRAGLTDQRSVERIQDKLTEAIKLQVSRNHSTEPAIFANILMKLPELRMLGTKFADQLVWYRDHWDKLHLPPLYAEIFDIPKNGEGM